MNQIKCCYQCPDRHPCCHSDCDRYRKEKREYERIKEIQQRARKSQRWDTFDRFSHWR